jgi:hypothetical protein
VSEKVIAIAAPVSPTMVSRRSVNLSGLDMREQCRQQHHADSQNHAGGTRTTVATIAPPIAINVSPDSTAAA